VQKHLFTAFDTRDQKAVNASLRGRRVLFDGKGELLKSWKITDDEAKDLRAWMTPKGWDQVKAYDALVDHLSR